MNPFVASLIAALKRLAQEDVDIRADVAAAGYVTSAQLTAALADYATDAELAAAVAALVDASPGALDTLNELAAALGDDPNFATTVTNAIAGRIALSLVEAKGDLIVGTGAGAVTRLPVGPDGTVATADSSQPGGIGWEPSAGLKTYASTAEVDAVGVTESGLYRFPTSAAARAFFGAGGAQIFVAAEVVFASYLSDAYGSGYPPAEDGRIQQFAEIQDGFDSIYTLVRSRGWDSGLQAWGPWGPWLTLPLPPYRPTTNSVWRAGSAVDGSGDTWLGVLEGDAPTGFAGTEADQHNKIAQVYTAWFNDASRQAIEGGELRIRSAGFDFQGILDGTRTDVGTVAFAARAAQTSQQAGRVEATAAAAGAAAVAGFHIPLGFGHRFGLILHATFAMTGGATGNTRLLCGLVATADIAAAMADNDPGSVANFIAAGYGSTDANISVFTRAAAALSSAPSGQAPSTSATAQLIDFRLVISPNSGSSRYYIGARNGSTVNRATGTLPVGFANSLPLSFFLRASAGGTSATPKVVLHRLRIGHGFGYLGGF